MLGKESYFLENIRLPLQPRLASNSLSSCPAQPPGCWDYSRPLVTGCPQAPGARATSGLWARLPGTRSPPPARGRRLARKGPGVTSGPAPPRHPSTPPHGVGWQFSLGQLKPVWEEAVAGLRAASRHLRERWRGADARLSRPRPRLSARRGAAGEGGRRVAVRAGAHAEVRAGGLASRSRAAAGTLAVPRCRVPPGGVTRDHLGNNRAENRGTKKRQRWSRSPLRASLPRRHLAPVLMTRAVLTAADFPKLPKISARQRNSGWQYSRVGRAQGCRGTRSSVPSVTF